MPRSRIVSSLSRLVYRLSEYSNAAGSMVVLLLVMIINYDVAARGIFNAPFHGAVEIVQFSMVLIVFLQLPDVVRVNRLTRSDGFLVVIGKRFPHVTRMLQHVIDTFSAILMILIAIAIWPEFIEMWHTQDYFGVPGIFTVLWWPVKLVIFLSTTFCALLFAMKVLVPVTHQEQASDLQGVNNK